MLRAWRLHSTGNRKAAQGFLGRRCLYLGASGEGMCSGGLTP